MGELRSCRLEARKVFFSSRNLAGLLNPVLGKRGLEFSHRRAFDPDHGVSPVFLILRVAGPLIGNAVTEHESDPPVDHDDLAVIAVIELSQIRGTQWMEL